ncbi:MAG: branched-chain amino acid ABC transporter permease [Pseudomonadota bacterium]
MSHFRPLALHLGFLAILFGSGFVLPEYHHGNLARVMVLATYAMGYNLLFGYTGLLSLGHAMFFAAGMYGMGLSIRYLGLDPALAMIAGVSLGALLSLIVGALALRTVGVAFMIVTLMFAQAVYLAILLGGEWTRGDEGFVIQAGQRVLWGADLSQPGPRFFAAWAVFAAGLLVALGVVLRPFGKALVAIRENEERTRMLGYDTFALKLGAVVLSGTVSALAGAAYGLLFGYAGATFAGVQYSILPLLWVLLGGAGTVIGPFIGTLFMFYLIDFASGLTTAYMAVAGVVLVLLTLFARQGIAGEVRRRFPGWIP